MSPSATEDDPIARLRAQGKIRPAKKNPAPWPDDYEEGEARHYTPEQIDEILDDLRGDR